MNKVEKALTEAALPKMLESLGSAMADAQYRLDMTAIGIARLMSQKGDSEGGIDIGGESYSLLELGFAPTFYQLTEANIEIKVSLSAAESQEFSIGAKVGVNLGYFAASVSASYSAKFSFESSASSSINARFVSVPAPTIFNQRLRATMDSGDGS
jgi:hypothetical protein